MALLTVQKPNFNGVASDFVAVSALGDTFANDGSTVIQIKNGSASSITATITSAQVCSQGFNHDIVVTIAAGATQIIGTFKPTRFNDTNGLVKVTCSSTDSVTINVFKID